MRQALVSVQALVILLSTAAGAFDYDPELVMSDEALFAALNLELPGLEAVATAVAQKDYAAARKGLAAHFRSRQGEFWWFDAHDRPTEPQKQTSCYLSITHLRDRVGGFPTERSLPNGDLDWFADGWSSKWPRLYFWQSLGIGFWESGCQEWGAEAWVELMRSFIEQCPLDKPGPYWATMTVGIQLRTGWSNAFCYFLHSKAFTPDAMALFLKGTLERARYLREKHSQTSNWLTFEMAGLYCTGTLYPEFRDASEWRRHAAQVAVNDMAAGYLPDGSSIELSPGYHQFFSNYLTMVRLAEKTKRLHDDGLDRLVAACEKPFEYYVRMMGPDRILPAFNDNAGVSAPQKLEAALELFPHRQDFLWVASDGKQGRPPEYTSCFFPYAGVAVMRSGWGKKAHCLIADVGPVGYRHAHQDKLGVVLWTHGRQILFDPGCSDYADTPETRYCRDTFSHNTALVDNRPQRRKWYQFPNPTRMPYRELTDVRWETTASSDWVAGVYDSYYGKPGPSDSYPYKKGGDFKEGWGTPAVHHRQILFLKPDLFVVWDRLTSKDGQPHTYDVRWHLDSTVVERDGTSTRTADVDKPNLELVPLLTAGLDVRVTSAQTEPELLGWYVAKEARPATTVQHLRSGTTVDLITLLLPSGDGAAKSRSRLSALESGRNTASFTLTDGRQGEVLLPPDPTGVMTGKLLGDPRQ